MDKKNLLFIVIIIVGIILARFIGERILLAGSLQINPAITDKLQTMLTTPVQENSNPLSSLFPKNNTPTPTPVKEKQPTTVDDLAQCLATKGFVMYGTQECPSCILEKSYFGPSFSRITYKDCDVERDLCTSKQISGYPTWEKPDGTKYKGAIPLDVLAQLSECPKPM